MAFYCGTKNNGKPKGTPNQCYKRGMGVGFRAAFSQLESNNLEMGIGQREFEPNINPFQPMLQQANVQEYQQPVNNSNGFNVNINDNEIENILNDVRNANERFDLDMSRNYNREADKLSKRLAKRNMARSQAGFVTKSNVDTINQILANAIAYSVNDGPEVIEGLQNDIAEVNRLFNQENNYNIEEEYERVINELIRLLNAKLEIEYESDEEPEQELDPIYIRDTIKADIKVENEKIKKAYKQAKKDKVPFNMRLDMSEFLDNLENFKKLFPNEKALIKDLTGLKSALVVEERKRNSN